MVFMEVRDRPRKEREISIKKREVDLERDRFFLFATTTTPRTDFCWVWLFVSREGYGFARVWLRRDVRERIYKDREREDEVCFLRRK